MSPVRPLLVALASCVALASAASPRPACVIAPDGLATLASGEARIAARTEGESLAVSAAAGQATLRLASVGGMAPEPAVDVVAPDGRLERRRGNVVEWYLSVDDGIEQGFDVVAPVDDSDSLVIRQHAGTGVRILEEGRAALVFGDDGRPALRVTKLVVVDARGTELPARFESGGATLDIAVDVRGAAWPVHVDPLISGPEWTADGSQERALFGRSIAGLGDVNGDGLTEMLVGARGIDGVAGADCGAAYLFRTTASGLESSPSWQAEGSIAGALFGALVAAPGDVNGDGFDDALVAEHGTFRVDAFLGSATGLSATPAWSVTSTQSDGLFGLAVSPAGDIDGDGFDDVAIGEPMWDGAAGHDVGRVAIFRGGASGLESTPSWSLEGTQSYARFGQAIAGGEDVDVDGFDDLLVGAPNFDSGDDDVGRVALYAGRPSGPSASPQWEVVGEQAGAWLGAAVALPGDLDGDGLTEVAAGEPGHDAFAGEEGRVLVWAGRAGFPTAAPAATWVGDPGDRAGGSVAAAGDLDDDGFADLAIGAPAAGDYKGRVVALCGDDERMLDPRPFVDRIGLQPAAELGRSLAGLGDVDGDGFSDLAASVWLQRGAAGDLAGRVRVTFGHRSEVPAATWVDARVSSAISHVGDVNGDGFGDVVVGSSTPGEARLFRGGPHGLETTPWRTWGSSDGMGSRATRAGDVDGDGFDDVLVSGSSGGTGRVRLFRGGVALGASASWTYSMPANLVSIAGAGDVNGDGFADVAVASPDASSSLGVIHVFLGSPAGLPSTPSQSLHGSISLRNLGTYVDAAGDVDGDGFDDVIATANQKVVLHRGGPTGLSLDPWAAVSSSVTVVRAAGDVNGDGFSDVAISPETWNRVDLYLGSAAGLGAAPAWSVSRPSSTGRDDLAGAGDVDGDGRDDLLISSTLADELFLYLGTDSGLAATPAATWTGTDVGKRVSLCGDVDGDGFADPVAIDATRALAFLGHGGGRRNVAIRVADRGLALRGGAPLGRATSVALPIVRAGEEQLEWRVGSAVGGGAPGPARVGEWSSRNEPLEGDLDLSDDSGRFVVQARVRSRDRLRQVSRWLSVPGNGAREADLLIRPNRSPVCGLHVDFVPTFPARFEVRSTATDPDLDALSVRWSLRGCGGATIDDETATATSVTLEGCFGGCAVQLEVSDGSASTSCESVITWALLSVTAGPDKTITCTIPSVVLAGMGTLPPLATVRWEPAELVSDPTSLTPTTSVGGTYVVTVTDPATGCVVTDEVVITDARSDDFASVSTSGPLDCQATSATLSATVSGGQPFSVAWSPASAVSDPTAATTTTSSPGTYSALVTDLRTGCQLILRVVVEDTSRREVSDLVARPAAEPLTLEKDSFGNIILRWEDGPHLGWSVFRAPLAGLWSTRELAPRSIGQCRLDVPAAVVAMPPDDSCYLVAVDCGGGRTGTLGRDSLGGERPAPSPGCP